MALNSQLLASLVAVANGLGIQLQGLDTMSTLEAITFVTMVIEAHLNKAETEPVSGQFDDAE